MQVLAGKQIPVHTSSIWSCQGSAALVAVGWTSSIWSVPRHRTSRRQEQFVTRKGFALSSDAPGELQATGPMARTGTGHATRVRAIEK